MSLKELFHKTIFKLGQRYRNPSLDKHYRFLKESEKWNRERLEQYQWEKFKEIIKYAYEHSVYYRRKWNEAGVRPEDIQTREDVKKIPIITKEELILHNKEIHSDEYFPKKFFSLTHGTTGQSLSFWKDENADSRNRAAIFRGYSWYGVQPWEFNGYFWGLNLSFWKKLKTRFQDWLVNRYRLFSYQEKNFKKFVRKIRNAVYLEGYSTAIYQIAKIINEQRLPKPEKLKLVKGTSEKIYPHYQEEVIKAFGQPMISEYGAAEAGLIAFECPQGNMHIHTEGVYVEEENGEIIVTNLVMRSFPVIRYRLGDMIRLKPVGYICSCGMKHPVIEEISGRIGSTIYGKTNIYHNAMLNYIFKNLDKNHKIKIGYQIIQNKKGFLDVHIDRQLSENDLNALKLEFDKIFGDDISINIYVKSDLYMNKSKKFVDIIVNIE